MFCVVSKRTSPHAYVWAKQLAPTRFFFLAVPLTRLRVGKMHNAHTTSLSHLPHGPARPAWQSPRVPAVAMVRTLFNVRLTAVAMSLNYSCHVGQLQLPWLLNCSCHLRSSARCHFWTTAVKEICPRGNNKLLFIFPYIMINVYYSC